MFVAVRCLMLVVDCCLGLDGRLSLLLFVVCGGWLFVVVCCLLSFVFAARCAALVFVVVGCCLLRGVCSVAVVRCLMFVVGGCLSECVVVVCSVSHARCVLLV